MKLARLLTTVILIVAFTTALQAQEKLNVPPPGYTALFNGKDLTGWRYVGSKEALADKTETGDGRIKVENGAIIMMEKDTAALKAFDQLCRLEGIIPALEPSHALAHLPAVAAEAPGALVVVNLSGRGDKDVQTAGRFFGFLGEHA